MLIKTNRIETIDLLRGVVMVLMALDHTRDYFHIGNSISDPTDLETTTPFLFFTRFITHYCAPVFIFLAGTSAFLYGSRKTKPQLFKFLFTRGLWLIFLEIVLNNLIWQFDPEYNLIVLQVIWAIGLCMVGLSFLIFLPKKILLVIGAILIAAHNTFDSFTFEGSNIRSILWYIFHQRQGIPLGEDHFIIFAYPIAPWLGVMVLGYCFGVLYSKDFNAVTRKKWLLQFGLFAIAAFFIIRGINIYGDMVPWTKQKNFVFTVLSFFNVTKYPPSLLYVLITLGPAMLFLYAFEGIKTKITDFFIVFGRVPLFYYFLHVLLIHALAILGILILGGSLSDLTASRGGLSPSSIAAYGYSLFVVYIVWNIIIAILYPICKKYMRYKAKNKAKWWLSYL
ncbi:DUF1624 domain-containing protein [Mangrovimonas xylaniphaga]|uniref:DUF1624 domain-containing protein n=1 Tax=Mangrovimonas xylaniphaga TaxID=1645915 RepID=UPI0006B58A46|nr:heparan-alpha-glucosaminide N-acetyltransferase domain-containing protein [Mangrovimonas xylaniphaga]